MCSVKEGLWLGFSGSRRSVVCVLHSTTLAMAPVARERNEPITRAEHVGLLGHITCLRIVVKIPRERLAHSSSGGTTLSPSTRYSGNTGACVCRQEDELRVETVHMTIHNRGQNTEVSNTVAVTYDACEREVSRRYIPPPRVHGRWG